MLLTSRRSFSTVQACGGASSLRDPDALGISFHMSLRRGYVPPTSDSTVFFQACGGAVQPPTRVKG